MQPPVLKIQSERSRPYQLEMFEASMKENTIVVVWSSICVNDIRILTFRGRWTLAVERHTCIMHLPEMKGLDMSPTPDTDVNSAVLRINAELERCPPNKV
jgi:hypothetical protein